jgi:hypothetical protein
MPMKLDVRNHKIRKIKIILMLLSYQRETNYKRQKNRNKQNRQSKILNDRRIQRRELTTSTSKNKFSHPLAES